MKKQQNEQIKRGGEIARARYQEFLKKPEWLHGLTDEERQLASDVLHDIFVMESQVRKTINVGSSNDGDFINAALRVAIIAKLGVVVRYINGPDLSLVARNN